MQDNVNNNFYTLQNSNEWVSIVSDWLSKPEAKKLANWWNANDPKHYYFVRPKRVLLPFRKVIRYDVIKTLLKDIE